MAAGTEHRREVARAYYLKNREKLLAKAKDWQRANPDYVRDWRRTYADRHKANLRRQRYGIEPEQFSVMLAAQDGKCAICQREMNPPHVDHNHTTGEVRGLLCDNCNRGVGHLQEDITVLTNAVRYLKKGVN